MTKLIRLLALCCILPAGWAAGSESLIGDWALVLPSGEAGWLAVRAGSGGPTAELMWGVGSARPIPDFRVDGNTFGFSRSARRPLAPKSEKAVTSRIEGRVEGDTLRLKMTEANGPTAEFGGRRMPPVPARPDLARVEFEGPITLFNGHDLAGWRVSNPDKKNGWRVQDGILRNETTKTDFSAYGEHANLRTEGEFTDFQLHVEFRLPAGQGGNSGIYLCGRYEVQVTHRDSSMQGINGPGALFGRIKPTSNAGKPAGAWETYDLTLVDRHVTVVHNGVKVIDHQPVAGPTGGALSADVTRPGPILLQGDHTAVEYRNLVLRPRRQVQR